MRARSGRGEGKEGEGSGDHSKGVVYRRNVIDFIVHFFLCPFFYYFFSSPASAKDIPWRCNHTHEKRAASIASATSVINMVFFLLFFLFFFFGASINFYL